MVGRKMSDCNPCWPIDDIWYHPNPKRSVRRIYDTALLLEDGYELSVTGIEVIGGIGITSRCLDKIGISNKYLLAKAYPNGRMEIKNQGRWKFLRSLCEPFGDDIASNNYKN